MLAAGPAAVLSVEDLDRLRAACRRTVIDPRRGLFGPESVVWRVNREAVALLGGGRAPLLPGAPPLLPPPVPAPSRLPAPPPARLRRPPLPLLCLGFSDAPHPEA